MTAFELSHYELAGFSDIFEPQTTYAFDQHFSSFKTILEEDHWNEIDEGEPCPVLEVINISKKSKTAPGAPVAPVSIANSCKRRSYILLP